MCGIVGSYHYKNMGVNDTSFIKWALTTMHHRGPDSNGIWSNQENYFTGFVRLSIRDLSENGNQPMHSECKNYTITFNGEIYNTENFKSRLEKNGVQFKSTTDTEVLLYSLIRWGAEYVLQHFDGIFAFAFYDNIQNKLILARDRSGIKPLYIGKNNLGIVYSSQYDHIINHSFFKNNVINEGALGAYLSIGYVPENSGIIENTFLLAHGFYAVIENKTFTTYRYFNYPITTHGLNEESLENLLHDSVKSQLVSDVPIGTFLSGGVDSPLVSYFASKSNSIKSFTIGVDDKYIDESNAAETFAKIFNTSHYTNHLTEKDLISSIESNTKAFSEPFADYSSIPTLLVSEFASKHVKVALSGDGGDELFWGYDRNIKMLRQGQAFRNHKSVRFLKLVKSRLFSKNYDLIRRHIEVNDFPAFYKRTLFMTGSEFWLPKIFKGKAETSFFFNDIYEQKGVFNTDDFSLMNILRKLEFDIHLQRILIKVDRASMYHSLEVRVPFLSNSIIDYSQTLNYKNCIENGIGKINLKKLLISKSNEELVMKPKKGFVIPIDNWIKQDLKKDIQDKLFNMPSELDLFFNKTQIENLLNEHFSGKQNWGWFIWSLYSLVNWNHQHRRSIAK
jgi:asparagine synthase (glutamine-hydrolysing)